MVKSFYVLKRWFEKPVDIVELFKDKFIGFVNEEKDDALFRFKYKNDEGEEREGILWLHCSSGSNLHNCLKVKGYLVGFVDFMNYEKDKIAKFEDRIEKELNKLIDRKLKE